MQDGEPLAAGLREPWRETRLAGVSRTKPLRSRPRAAESAERGRLPPVADRHRGQLEALIDLLRIALELETRCDFGDGPQASGPGRGAFVAHFDGWKDALEDWEEGVRRARVAPAALWSSLDEAARRIGLPEPPLEIGPLVDCLATLTARRSREGRLGVPHTLFHQSLRSGYGESARTTVYIEGQSVARLLGDNRPLAVEIEGRIQRLFDAVQRSEAALEVGRATDAVREAKDVLLERLNTLAAADAIVFAPCCPICGGPPAAKAVASVRSPA